MSTPPNRRSSKAYSPGVKGRTASSTPVMVSHSVGHVPVVVETFLGEWRRDRRRLAVAEHTGGRRRHAVDLLDDLLLDDAVTLDHVLVVHVDDAAQFGF